MDRRDFVRAGLAGAALARGVRRPAGPGRGEVVSLVADPNDPVASAAPSRWALAELGRTLDAAGVEVRIVERLAETGPADLCILASGPEAPMVAAALARADVAMPDTPEALAQVPTRISRRRTLLACGVDTRGLVFALLDLADRVRPGKSAAAALALDQPVVERPANAVRSVMRQFTSATLDTPWFHDRDSWTHYLAMLATHRFNRLHLAFGLGYDSLRRVADSYFLFVYPFLLSVPGHDVRVTNLPDDERDRNLETLRFIGAATVARGLDFQLGIWMHGYQLVESPDARYVVEGLTADTHAAYCRDALAALLGACPAISSVALRIHGESGIPEGSYDFWGTVMDGVARCGRRVEIDLHAKGLDAAMIERALATGMPVNVSPKFAAEHLGMPYHQAAIRELEMPVPGRTGAGPMALSEGARIFTRYGYADFLRDDRRYTVRPRVFSGTQRLLAWGDPAFAAAGARAFQFCGMTGADLMEPLTCRGRRGTGDGTRLGYADERLAPRWDWQKYEAWYRTWGRATYDPDTPAAVFGRSIGDDARGRHLASSLARASRILPIVTNAYLPSAACDAYWPEIYWDQPLVGPIQRPAYLRAAYLDTPAPRTFQHASPLDPQLFASPDAFAQELLGGERSGRVSPVEVAMWVEDLAELAEQDLGLAGAAVATDRLRIAIDVRLLAGLGRFFAAKLRAGVLYAIHERTGDRRALLEAAKACAHANNVWAQLAMRGRDAYQADLSASDRFTERGQWMHRRVFVDQNFQQVAMRLGMAPRDDPRAGSAIEAALGDGSRSPLGCAHTPPPGFRPGAAVDLRLAVAPGPAVVAVRVLYRHVNQAERYESAEMAGRGRVYRASIPSAYTDSPYPLQYYFVVQGKDETWLHPGFGPELTNPPYYVLGRV